MEAAALDEVNRVVRARWSLQLEGDTLATALESVYFTRIAPRCGPAAQEQLHKLRECRAEPLYKFQQSFREVLALCGHVARIVPVEAYVAAIDGEADKQHLLQFIRDFRRRGALPSLDELFKEHLEWAP